MTELGRFVDTFANGKPKLRRRLGTIVSVEGATNSITVNIAGGSTNISGVRFFGHYPPVAGKQVWLDTDGVDLIAVGSIAGNGGVTIAGRVEKNSNQDQPNVNTKVTFASVVTDPAAAWLNASDRWVAPVAGVYQFNAGMVYLGQTDTNSRTLFISINGTTRATTRVPNIGLAGTSLIQNLSCIYQLAAGDYAELYVNQGTGSTITGGLLSNNSTYFAMAYLGPYA